MRGAKGSPTLGVSHTKREGRLQIFAGGGRECLRTLPPRVTPPAPLEKSQSPSSSGPGTRKLADSREKLFLSWRAPCALSLEGGLPCELESAEARATARVRRAPAACLALSWES